MFIEPSGLFPASVTNEPRTFNKCYIYDYFMIKFFLQKIMYTGNM